MAFVLQDMKFVPSKGETYVWMRPGKDGSCYEYIAVYVDDLDIATKDLNEITDQIQHKNNFK